MLYDCMGYGLVLNVNEVIFDELMFFFIFKCVKLFILSLVFNGVLIEMELSIIILCVFLIRIRGILLMLKRFEINEVLLM